MPQLDFLIILPQIFWLIFFFSFLYFLLTYFFLPLFLKTLNSRKYLLKTNKSEENKLIGGIIRQRHLIFKDLILHFDQIRVVLFFRVLHSKFKFFKKPFNYQFLKSNNKISKATANTILYCNPIVLNTIKFYPRILKK